MVTARGRRRFNVEVRLPHFKIEVKPGRRYAAGMSASRSAPRPGPDDGDPPWLSEQERDAWLEVATLTLQLPALLDAQLQRDADLGLFEYTVMSWLSMAPDRRARMGELARLAQGSVSRLSNVVKRLEHRGFVHRAPDPTNGRYTLATLTEAGWDKVVQAAPGHVRAVRRYVLDPLTPSQVGDLRRLTSPIAERIRGDAGGGLPAAPADD
jgi:DNA-binding MarR family transcriptional regulator